MVIFAGAVIILTIYNILHIIQGKELVGQRKEAEQK